MAFPDIVIGSKLDAKGFKQAESALGRLNKSAKGLGATLGVSLGTAAVVAFGKVTVKAFMDDQKAAAQLTNTVKNLGLAYANTDIQKFVEKLSLATGVADDDLRPAMQKLLQTTGSVIESQKLLTTAIDISKGSSVDMATVALDLSNAFVGNNKGLKKYALGISAAELKTASFDKVLSAFNRSFAGAGKADLATVAGQFGLITNAAKEAEETIGSGLVDAFKTLTGGTGITNLSAQISKLATNIADFFRGLAIGFRDLANMPVIKQLLQLAGLMLKLVGKVAGAVVNPFIQAGAASKATGYGDYAGSTDAVTRAKNAAAAVKAEAAAKQRAKDLAKTTAKNTAELKKQVDLKKAGSVFDLQQIELVAALKGKLSDEEKLRVEAQLALLNGNDAVAKQLTEQILKAQDSTGNLSRLLASLPDAKNPFQYLDGYLNGLAMKAAALSVATVSGSSAVTGINPTNPSAVTPIIPSTNASASEQMISYNQNTGLSYNPNAGNQPVINVVVQGSVIKEQELIQQIQNGTQLASLSGSPSQIGRIAGMFG